MSGPAETAFDSLPKQSLFRWMQAHAVGSKNDNTRLFIGAADQSDQALVLAFAQHKMKAARTAIENAGRHDLQATCGSVIKVLAALDNPRGAPSPVIQCVREEALARADDCQASHGLTGAAIASPTRMSRQCEKYQEDANALIENACALVRDLMSLKTQDFELDDSDESTCEPSLNEVLCRYFTCEEREDGRVSYENTFSSSSVLGVPYIEIKYEDLELWAISPVACLLYWILGVVLKSIESALDEVNNALPHAGAKPERLNQKSGLDKFNRFADSKKEHDACVADAHVLLKAFILSAD